MFFLVFMVSFAWAEMVTKGPDLPPSNPEETGFYLLDPPSLKHECPVLEVIAPYTVKGGCIYFYDTEKDEYTFPTQCVFYVKSKNFVKGIFFGSNTCEIIVREELDAV